MKNLIFENIWLLSRLEKKARLIQFHPNKNLIIGQNHTGKSSLIKTLFRTLGARPQGELAHWDENMISVVSLYVEQKKYYAVHQNGNRALFNKNGKLIVATGSHDVWSEAFSQLVGFNLLLADKKSNSILADPHCFFLVFYINQDGSWQSNWETFTGLKRYQAPVKAILEYFTGVKPPEYYEISSKRAQLQRRLDDLRKEYQFLERARERFSKSMSLSGPKVQPDNFKQEIARLTTEVTELNRQQEKLREAAIREREILTDIQLQIQLAYEALAIYDKDSSFLQSEPKEKLVCPTCNAEHNELFLDMLIYAEDARVLRELVARLYIDATKASQQYNNSQARLRELENNYRRVSEILNTRRGELKFSDVVNSLGAENAYSAFEAERTVLKGEIDQLHSEIETLDEYLKKLINPKRSQEILQNFRKAYLEALTKLNLPQVEINKLQLTSRPKLSGSGGPRSLLAYYGALWQTCFGEYKSFFVPLVIDSPNQQSQDYENLPKILKYIAKDLPVGSQIIVGAEMETNYIFDNKINLDQPYKLLRGSEYSEVEKIVEPLVTQMYDALLN